MLSLSYERYTVSHVWRDRLAYYPQPLTTRYPGLMIFRLLLSPILLFALLLSACASEPSYDEQMAEQHRGDRPDATAIVMEPIIPVMSEEVTYGVGEDVELVGYFSEPIDADSVLTAMGRDADDNLPALILIHEWWGLNDNIRLMARRFAGEGFRVLAVDLYDGEVTTSPESAQAAMAHVSENPAAIDANIRAAFDYLAEQHGAGEIAVLGWCFGGTVALRSAVLLSDELDAAVIYYGRLSDMEREHLDRIEAPVLAFFGGQDESIPLDDVRAFESAMRELDKDADVHVYERAGHAFANPSGLNYDDDAAQASWGLTTHFLREHLYGQAELRPVIN